MTRRNLSKVVFKEERVLFVKHNPLKLQYHYFITIKQSFVARESSLRQITERKVIWLCE